MASLIIKRPKPPNKVLVVASRVPGPIKQPGNCPGAQCVVSTLSEFKAIAHRVLNRIDDIDDSASAVIEAS